MWQHIWPERDREAPITHVTNGVHVPTWIGTPMRLVLERYLGPLWLERLADPIGQAALAAIPDDELWQARCEQRLELVAFARERSVLDRLARGEPRSYAEAAANALDPEVLTFGFARRVATYKRLHLFLHDRVRALRFLSGDRPIQLVLAGKAHPSDDGAKLLIQELFSVKDDPAVRERVVFLEDYELDAAARLVRGCDVWVNLPRPPLEASGTSGMKSAINGGLQLGVLDGWWAEGYDGTNGWALSGEVDDDHRRQDARDAEELYRLVEDEVAPAFYERGDDGIPSAWLTRIRASLCSLGYEFSAGRMLEDYEQRMYAPLLRASAADEPALRA
jgi:starch phosphorylase